MAATRLEGVTMSLGARATMKVLTLGISILLLFGAWGPHVSGQGRQKPTLVDGLRWHQGLGAALSANKNAKAPRPIFFLRMLGDLQGLT